jgi:predicted DNA-binding ribbon-helix-helix protein
MAEVAPVVEGIDDDQRPASSFASSTIRVQCGEVLMDCLVARCAGGREAKSNKSGLWPSV